MPPSSSIQEVLGNPASAVEVLLGLLSDAAVRRDISAAVPDVIQARDDNTGFSGPPPGCGRLSTARSVPWGRQGAGGCWWVDRSHCPWHRAGGVGLQAVFGRSNTSPQVRKLAYDVCKAVTLSDIDCNRILTGVKVGPGWVDRGGDGRPVGPPVPGLPSASPCRLYRLCDATTPLRADLMRPVWDAMRTTPPPAPVRLLQADVIAGEPDVAAAALSFLPTLPGHQLASLLEIGRWWP